MDFAPRAPASAPGVSARAAGGPPAIAGVAAARTGVTGAGAPVAVTVPGAHHDRVPAAPIPAADPSDGAAPGFRRVIVRPAPGAHGRRRPSGAAGTLDGVVRPSPGAADPFSGRTGPDPIGGPPPEPALPGAAGELSPGSFEDFYRATRGSVGRALALALGDADLAADATDEALARAFERWSMVSRLDRPEGWVYRVGLNWSLSVLRRRRRSPHRLYERPVLDGPQPADPDLHAALGALDVKHRSVVVCRHLLGWSVADTAAALGVRQGTVKSRLHRALATLQRHLDHLRAPEEES